jgi:hypothetical protein
MIERPISHDQLIRGLTADLAPVRRLRSPSWRAILWLACVAALGCVLAVISNIPAMLARLDAAPDLWLVAIGSTLTMVLAAVAAFELSLPDASGRWAFLPVPGALLWLAGSGAGCLRGWVVPGAHPAVLSETGDCLTFIVLVSVPLSALLIFMLRRAYSLRPTLTAAVAGLAAAAAAATLLNFFHPYDASATDLVVHAAAVTLVIAANRLVGGRLLQATVRA